jgi:hypothetical protein
VRRSLAFTLVPILALAGVLVWAQRSIATVESRGDPALYARAVAWERALAGTATDSPLTFVHPSVRAHPALRIWLAEVAQRFADAGGAQILEAKVLDEVKGVSTYAIQAGEFTRRPATIQFRWVKADDGVWYVLRSDL